MSLIIKNSDIDMNGNAAENIFIALEDGKYVGHGYVYPYFNYEIALDEPYNLLIDFAVNNYNDDAWNQLYEKVMERALQLRKKYPESKARIYGGGFSNELAKIKALISKGLIRNDGVYLYQTDLSLDIPKFEIPKNIRITKNRMDKDGEKDNFIKIHNDIFIKKLDIDKFMVLMKEEQWTNFSAYDGDRLVGNIMIFEKIEEKPSGRIGFIENLFVLKEWQGQKIASTLVTTALSHFKNRSINKVQLEVWGRNKKAIELYKSLGFKYMEEKEVYPGINL